jgi:serine-type D-Ala-D-Ala carboxypeptidase
MLTAPQQDVIAPAGAAVVIAEGDQQIVSTAGFADLSTREVMTQEHVHDLASVSKLITTLALQRLFSLGEISAQHTLGRFFGANAGAHGEVTVHNLLRHRSGFREWWPLYLQGSETEAEAAADPITRILAMPPRYPRGTEWHYSDLGMQVAGAVIAQVTSRSLSEAVRELILNPLGASTVTAGKPYPGASVASGPLGDAIEQDMVASHTPYPVDDMTRAAAAEFPWREHQIRGEVADGNAFHAFGTGQGRAAGHAGWFGDADGLLRLAQALVEPKAVGIRMEAAAQMRHTGDDSPLRRSSGFTQGLGARLYTLPWRGEARTFIAHPGFTGTFLAAAPATENAPAVRAVMLTNRLHGSPLHTRTTLISVDQMWRRAMAAATSILHAPAGEAAGRSAPAFSLPKRTGGAP